MDGSGCIGVEFNDPNGNLAYIGYDGTFSRFIFMTDVTNNKTQISGTSGNVVLGHIHASNVTLSDKLDVSGIDVSNNMTVRDVSAGKVSAISFEGEWKGDPISSNKLPSIAAELASLYSGHAVEIGTTKINFGGGTMDLAGLTSVSVDDLSCNTTVVGTSISCPVLVLDSAGTQGKIRFNNGNFQGTDSSGDWKNFVLGEIVT
jgi:hypothetical protein